MLRSLLRHCQSDVTAALVMSKAKLAGAAQDARELSACASVEVTLEAGRRYLLIPWSMTSRAMGPCEPHAAARLRGDRRLQIDAPKMHRMGNEWGMGAEASDWVTHRTE